MLLQKATSGDDGARAEVLDKVYQNLRSMAEGKLRGEAPGHSLQATVLVHDAYLQLLGDGKDVQINDRQHFYILAAKAMRRILVDHARRRKAAKRGGPDRHRVDVEADQLAATKAAATEDVLAVHAALKRLSELDARQADVIELRFFGGYTVEETADLLDVSPRTVKADYAAAKAWLYRELSTS